ncbi:MAG: hypothetical protein ACK4NX_00650 [Candidatus Paceibacteria bacterium]
MAINFAIYQGLYRFFHFFYRWFIEASLDFWSWVLEYARALDKTFAILINVKLWLQPLYGDYSPVGRIIGPVFRTIRIFLGAISYAIFFGIAFLLWIFWLSIPIFIVFKILFG